MSSVRRAQRATLLASVAWLAAAGAAEPELIGEYRDWSVHRYEENERTVCYAASAAVSRHGDADGRGESWVLVSHDSYSLGQFTVSYTAPEGLDPGGRIRASIGEREFLLAAEGDTAWTVRPRANLKLLVAMKRGRRLTIGALAADGARIIDTFSLMGLTRAVEAATEACRS